MSGKVRYHELSEFQKKKYLGEFYSMVALLKNRKEVKIFFKDLLTLSEVVMISRRIQVAKMLLDGHEYDEIREKLGVGNTTINHVEKWVNSGFGGYRQIIRRYKSKRANKDFEKNLSHQFSWQHIKRKYPLHFLLLNSLGKK